MLAIQSQPSVGAEGEHRVPGAARLGDKAQVDADAHGCPSCPHPAIGPIVIGSPDVNINNKPAARLDDIGIHAVCCGPNNFTIVKGSPTVYVNGKPLARQNDKTKHCGGSGPIKEGSPDVLIDDGASPADKLEAYVTQARKINSEKAAENKKGTQKKISDQHNGGGGGGGAGGRGAGGAGGRGGPAAKGPSGKPHPQPAAAAKVKHKPTNDRSHIKDPHHDAIHGKPADKKTAPHQKVAPQKKAEKPKSDKPDAKADQPEPQHTLSSPEWVAGDGQIEHGTEVGMRVAATQGLEGKKVRFTVEVKEGSAWKPHAEASASVTGGKAEAKVKLLHPLASKDGAIDPAFVRFSAEVE
jgi:uncharacterized Zn-binding protein involved in type VI secretion/outer membrane biosynthesis protein TonB